MANLLIVEHPPGRQAWVSSIAATLLIAFGGCKD
jgi:hypothetical protein